MRRVGVLVRCTGFLASQACTAARSNLISASLYRCPSGATNCQGGWILTAKRCRSSGNGTRPSGSMNSIAAALHARKTSARRRARQRVFCAAGGRHPFHQWSGANGWAWRHLPFVRVPERLAAPIGLWCHLGLSQSWHFAGELIVALRPTGHRVVWHTAPSAGARTVVGSAARAEPGLRMAVLALPMQTYLIAGFVMGSAFRSATTRRATSCIVVVTGGSTTGAGCSASPRGKHSWR